MVDIESMNTLHHFLPRLVGRRPASRDSGMPSSLTTRIEVCPPALWPPSSLTFWGRARRWLARSAWTPADQRPVNRLALVKDEFRRSLDDLRSAEASALSERIDRARSLREMWHLRSVLYGLLAMAFDQREAEQRMGRLNRHFPVRAPRLVPTH